MAHKISAQPIAAKTKGEVKRLRKGGSIPVSIQHKGGDPVHLQIEARRLEEFISRYGGATLLELEVEGGTRSALVHQVQRDHMGHLLHVALKEARRDEAMRVQVPISYHGHPESARRGEAVLQHQLEELEIRCLPGDLPDHIVVDIGHLGPNEVLRVKDLPVEARYEMLTPPDAVLVSMTAPTVLSLGDETPAPAPAPDAATPAGTPE